MKTITVVAIETMLNKFITTLKTYQLIKTITSTDRLTQISTKETIIVTTETLTKVPTNIPTIT